MNGTETIQLGQVVVTTNLWVRITNSLDETEAMREFSAMLERHRSGDWGNVGDEDWKANNQALEQGTRLFSTYAIGDEPVWIITEADRSVTTLLLPEDY
jgi:hypothetical protein